MQSALAPGTARGSSQGGRRRSWARVLAAAGTAVAVGAALTALTSPAQGLNSNRTGPVDDRGFPEYYTDDSGLSLMLCEDGTANCLGAVQGDLVAPEGEALYWAATATVPTSRGDLNVEFALEAAFGDAGEPIVFDRVRIRGHLSRRGRYVLQHPYGRTRFRAVTPREQRNVNLTEDLPCSLRRGGGCGGHITNFLRSRNAPTGYVGAGERPTRVKGGTARNELVVRTRRGRVIGRTRQIAVLGKLAPGPQAALSRTAVDFGNTARRRERTVRVRNLGDQPLNFSDIRLRGADTIRIVRRDTTCRAARNVAAGRGCRVTLAYKPARRRESHARLVVEDNTIAGIHRIQVSALTTSEFSARRRMHFAKRRVGTESRHRRIVVENTGAVPLKIRSVALAGRNRKSFDLGSGEGPVCARGLSVRPRGVCAVYVAFTPKSFGLKRAAVRVESNALSSPDRVRLNGRGR